MKKTLVSKNTIATLAILPVLVMSAMTVPALAEAYQVAENDSQEASELIQLQSDMNSLRSGGLDIVNMEAWGNDYLAFVRTPDGATTSVVIDARTLQPKGTEQTGVATERSVSSARPYDVQHQLEEASTAFGDGID